MQLREQEPENTFPEPLCEPSAPGGATQLTMRSEFNNFLRRHSELTSDLEYLLLKLPSWHLSALEARGSSQRLEITAHTGQGE